MEQPNHLIYASKLDVKMNLHNVRIKKQQEMLVNCEEIQLKEVDGEQMVLVNMEVYNYLVDFLKKHTE